jgi:hypothetical protein
MSSLLKTYYTELMAEEKNKNFDSMKKKSIQFRKDHPELILGNLTKKQIKTLFLVPMVYRFYQEMDLPESLAGSAREVLLEFFSGEGLVESKAVREFLTRMEEYSDQDLKTLKKNLFTQLYELDCFKLHLDESTEDILEIEKTIRSLQIHVKMLGAEQDYNEFKLNKREQEIKRIIETMDRAFWDGFREDVAMGGTKKEKILHKTILEIKNFLLELKHPSLGEGGAPYIESILDVEFLVGNVVPGPQLLNIFIALLIFLKECDSLEMEKVYQNAIVFLGEKSDPLDVLVDGIRILYDLILQLRLKISVLTT